MIIGVLMSTLLILSNTERREFESEPILTLREQQYFFNIPASLYLLKVTLFYKISSF